MGEWRKSSKNDYWEFRSAEHQEEMAAVGLYGLFKNDLDAETATVRRCPKCNHRTFHKSHPDDKQSSKDSNWLCSHCGNDADEFGNKL
ncbi:MAG: hypothetical protein KAU94_08685 [Verrucomicrobia bacterium]|nr:hypothetical protein [Verrucomicrobiota bacterium]